MTSRRMEIEPIEIEPMARPSLQGQQMELLPSFDDIQLQPEEERIDHDSEVIRDLHPCTRGWLQGWWMLGLFLLPPWPLLSHLWKQRSKSRTQAWRWCACWLRVECSGWFFNIFLVYRRATPGMNFAGLELCTFEGKATTMFERQCRAAASALSGFLLGLGYFWALVDEDRVGWHDRISRTHVRAFLQSRAA